MKDATTANVLVVDDDADVLQTVVTRLKGAGWQVGEARGGRSRSKRHGRDAIGGPSP